MTDQNNQTPVSTQETAEELELRLAADRLRAAQEKLAQAQKMQLDAAAAPLGRPVSEQKRAAHEQVGQLLSA